MENQVSRQWASQPSSILVSILEHSQAESRVQKVWEHWDKVIANFLREAGLTQAMRGFESDMIIMNPDWEHSQILVALSRLVDALQQNDGGSQPDEQSQTPVKDSETSLDARKLGYVHFASGVKPQTPSTVTKSISCLLAQNRARNDASNRQEFLLSPSDKRRRINESGEYEGVVASCARTDAKIQNRDLQMRFDVAKNEDGPLRKTVVAKTEEPEAARRITGSDATEGQDLNNGENDATAERYPGLDERLRNIEAHVAVRYVPSPPRSLLDRLKFIEDHLVHLETEYPPWAALHFNQPRRGWPAPPRPTPIIVPSHLTSAAASSSVSLADRQFVPMVPPEKSQSTAVLSAKAKGKQAARTAQSSLHRAVMERLEVQKAMNDLAGKEL